MTAAQPNTPASGPQSSPSSGNRRRSWGRWALIVSAVLAVACFYLLGLHRYLQWDYVRGSIDTLEAYVKQNYLTALVTFFLVYVAMTALSLPAAAVLSLVAGAVFDRWVGTGVVSIAATLGATLAFLGSRYVLRDFMLRRWGDKLRAINEGVERDGGYYLFTLRLVPAFPFFLINLGMGLTPLRVGTYVWVSFVGMLPGTFLYVNTGTAIRSINSPADVLSRQVVLSLALLGLAPLVFRKVVQWKARQRAHG